MNEIDIPASERDKIFPFVPKSVIPIILVTVFILGILITDIATGESTNVFIFYAVPFAYLLIFLGREDIPIILNLLGLSMPTLRSKIVGILCIPLGLLGGWLLVKFSGAYSSILPIATYPFAISSYAEAGLGFLATMGGSANVFFFLFVAFFEEGTSIYLFKNIANWIYDKFKIKNTPLIILISIFLARCVLCFHHFVSYGGWSQPYLYFSALMLFMLFSILAILTGLLAKGTFGELSTIKIIPYFLPIAVALHFGFDYFLSRLMIIP